MDAGRVPYEEALELQRRLARARIDGRLDEDLLLLVEHEPVLTLGRNARREHVAAAPEVLARRGVPVVEIERGGDVTYHGPGQLVGYPILDLRGWRRDLHWYLRTLEEALVRALGGLGLPAFRVGGHTGVWVGEGPDGGLDGDVEADAAPRLVAAGAVRKIASIGVHVSRWVTWHGFALNVTEEPLAWFPLIVPCGIPDVRMTSVHAEGVGADPGRVREAVADGFAAAFGAELVRGADLERPEAGRGADIAGGAGRGAGAGQAEAGRGAGLAWPGLWRAAVPSPRGTDGGGARRGGA